MLTLFIFGLVNPKSAPVLAEAVRRLSASEATGEGGAIATLTVWSGSGLNLLMPDGETIQKVWLDDPSRLTVDFDTPLCSGSRDCSHSGGASAIHLRRINPINFSALPKSSSTLLTVIAQGSQGRKRYLFRLTYGKGTPQYYGVTLEASPQHTSGETSSFKPSSLLEIERGLQVAKDKGWISQGQGNQALEWQVRSFLTLVEQGTPMPQAAKQAGISMALIQKLASLGDSSVFQGTQPASAFSLDSNPVYKPLRGREWGVGNRESGEQPAPKTRQTSPSLKGRGNLKRSAQDFDRTS
ncbi:MAG: hypothetical protein ACRDEA_22575, partial [Microcystaceae cyanobacterium]